MLVLPSAKGLYSKRDIGGFRRMCYEENLVLQIRRVKVHGYLFIYLFLSSRLTTTARLLVAVRK